MFVDPPRQWDEQPDSHRRPRKSVHARRRRSVGGHIQNRQERDVDPPSPTADSIGRPRYAGVSRHSRQKDSELNDVARLRDVPKPPTKPRARTRPQREILLMHWQVQKPVADHERAEDE